MLQLSIIIPALNEGWHIDHTIAFLKQHGGDAVLEIIVADGGSTDDTVQKSVAAGAAVVECPQKGRNFQMNYAAEKSRGKVLYFVHADTLPPPEYCTAIEEALAKGVRLGNFRYRFDSPHLLLRINGWFTRWHFMFCQGGDKTLFIERTLFEQLGGYRAECVVMEEYDLLHRAKEAGYAFQVLPYEGVASARKYVCNSWLRVQMANLLVFNLWSWKLTSPERLKKIYGGMLRR
jgi:rSAM/selenodomain-associated transferase 2